MFKKWLISSFICYWNPSKIEDFWAAKPKAYKIFNFVAEENTFPTVLQADKIFNFVAPKS